MKTLIKDFYGKVIGSIEVKPDGTKIVRDFYGKVLGKYDPRHDATKDFYGRILFKGDQSGMLLSLANNK